MHVGNQEEILKKSTRKLNTPLLNNAEKGT